MKHQFKIKPDWTIREMVLMLERNGVDEILRIIDDMIEVNVGVVK